MLRITRSTRDRTAHVRLEGKLVGPWVDESRAACARETGEGLCLALDVSEVRFADREGARFLREMESAGHIATSNGYTAELMRKEEAMARCGNGHGARTGLDAPALARGLRAGDEGACEELVRRNACAMLETARRFLPRELDAIDALKESFQTAFRSAETCPGDPQLEEWLHRIVVDVCVARLRRIESRTSIEGLLPAFDSSGHHAAPVAAWNGAPSPEHDALRRHVAQLPAPYRVVLLLCDAEGLTTREAARRLGLSHVETAARLRRAHQALRTLLANTLAPTSAS